MARFYTRAERRAYKEARQEQAATVANRLLGRRAPVQFDHTSNPLKAGRTATAAAQMKQMAMDMKIEVLLASEPGEAARKRREEEDKPVPPQVPMKQYWPVMPLQYDPYGKLWIGHRDD